jgi:hypothetical protein
MGHAADPVGCGAGGDGGRGGHLDPGPDPGGQGGSGRRGRPSDEVARADFDGDGFVDLAVGVPGEDVEALADAGSVVVLYDSAAGLTGARAQQFHQNLPQLVDRAESGDRVGAVLSPGPLGG